MVGGSDPDLGSKKCPSDYPWLLITSRVTSGGNIMEETKLHVLIHTHTLYIGRWDYMHKLVSLSLLLHLIHIRLQFIPKNS